MFSNVATHNYYLNKENKCKNTFDELKVKAMTYDFCISFTLLGIEENT